MKDPQEVYSFNRIW